MIVKVILLFLVLLAALFIAAYVSEKLGLNSSKPAPQINAGPSSEARQYLEAYDYPQFAAVVMDCVHSNYAQCSLCRPASLPQHMAPDGARVLYRSGCLVYQYDFDRITNCVGNIREGFKNVYTTLPVSAMSKHLNATISNYCIAYGYPPVKIIDQCDLPNGRVRFTVGPIRWGC